MDPSTSERRAMKTVAIIPVKTLAGCKQRLAGQFGPEQRAALMLAMLGDVIAVLQEAGWPEQVWVVSADPAVLEYARQHGAVGIRERSTGLNEAVACALSFALVSGLEAALVLHGDLPGITASEVLTIRTELADAAPGSVGVVVSKDGGTSALYLSPVNAMLPQFGVDSGRVHLERVRAKGLPVHLIQLSGFSCDIDVPADIAAFVGRNHPGRTSDFLSSCLPHKV